MKMELSFCFNTNEPDVSHTVSSLWRHFFIWYDIMGLMFYDDCEYVKLCEEWFKQLQNLLRNNYALVIIQQ